MREAEGVGDDGGLERYEGWMSRCSMGKRRRLVKRQLNEKSDCKNRKWKLKTRRRLRGNTVRGVRDWRPKGRVKEGSKGQRTSGMMAVSEKEGNCHLDTYYQKNE